MKSGAMTAVITGGGQGIGRIISDTLLVDGWQVAIWEYDIEAVEEENARRGDNIDWLGIECDVTCMRSVQEALDKTLEVFGKIDLLVNNAAIHANKPLNDLEIPEFRKVIDVNLTGPLICVKNCEHVLRKTNGSVINICSTRAFMSEPDTEAYSASKGGLIALTHALAVSLGPDVRVNSISPGWIDVSATRKTSKAKQEKLSQADHLQHPAGRVGEGEDIARMVRFLADPANDFITAQNFVIDGGMTRKMIYV